MQSEEIQNAIILIILMRLTKKIHCEFCGKVIFFRQYYHGYLWIKLWIMWMDCCYNCDKITEGTQKVAN